MMPKIMNIPSSNKRVAVLSFSDISKDGRVLRHAEYISRLAPVILLGMGARVSAPNISMVSFTHPDGSLWHKIKRRIKTRRISQPPYKVYPLYRKIMIALGKKVSPVYFEKLYWNNDAYTEAYHALIESHPSTILVNNWDALPVGVRAARELNAKIILDLHEYSPMEMDERPDWKSQYFPLIDYVLRRYLPEIHAVTTVNQAIADRYYEDYGIQATVVMSAPSYNSSVSFRPTDPEKVHLIHHGGALPDRKMESMVEALALTDKRYCLHFMLVGRPDYQEVLRKKAAQIAPGRVFFEEPVTPAKLVERISSYDLGFYILPIIGVNYQLSLPNKFFEFVNAGLGMCIGPSPEMERLVRQYGFGVVAPSFDPAIVAETLNRLTAEMIDEMKRKSLKARKELNADIEMGKMIALYQSLQEGGT